MRIADNFSESREKLAMTWHQDSSPQRNPGPSRKDLRRKWTNYCRRSVKTLSEFGFLVASKNVMAMLGVDCGPVRPPLRNLTVDQRLALWERLSALDVFPRPLRRPD